MSTLFTINRNDSVPRVEWNVEIRLFCFTANSKNVHAVKLPWNFSENIIYICPLTSTVDGASVTRGCVGMVRRWRWAWHVLEPVWKKQLLCWRRCLMTPWAMCGKARSLRRLLYLSSRTIRRVHELLISDSSTPRFLCCTATDVLWPLYRTACISWHSS